MKFIHELIKKFVTDIYFYEDTMCINKKTLKLNFAIEYAFRYKKYIIILYKHGEFAKSKNERAYDLMFPFRNLVAIDFEGNEIWKAELPTDKKMDCYYRIVKHKPLIVDSVCSYECKIDLETGKIIDKVFFK